MRLSRGSFSIEEGSESREEGKGMAAGGEMSGVAPRNEVPGAVPGSGMSSAAPGGGPPVAYRTVKGATPGGRPAVAYSPETACFLEEIYSVCNRIERLDLDPLAVVRRYSAPEDIEVAGLVCSTLAFGSVQLILRACETALEPLGTRPANALRAMDQRDIERQWGSFQYRFCFPNDMIALMGAIRKALLEYGSLEAVFLQGDKRRVHGAPMLEAASAFVRTLRRFTNEVMPSGLRKNLLPDPADGSASKRLFLFFRWMIRRDEIDPGPWSSVDPSRLVVPMDVHMARTCAERLHFLPGRRERAAAGRAGCEAGGAGRTGAASDADEVDGPASGLDVRKNTAQSTSSTSAPHINLRTALQITEAFRLYAPDDPVKYDFALTRPGIDPHPGDERFGCL